MELTIVSIPKAKLDRIPEIERAFYIHIGHLRNEVWVLTKMLGWSFNSHVGNRVVIDVNVSVSLIIERLLAGKLCEGWALLRRAYIDTSVKLSIEKNLSDETREAFGNLEEYFSKRDNIINKIRNRFAFHYDPQKVKEELSSLKETDKLEVCVAERSSNMFYSMSETIANSAMLDSVQSGDYDAAAGRLAKEILDISRQFITFCDGCLTHMSEKYLGSSAEELHIEKVEIPEPPSHTEIQLSFFDK
jgi:hypothetical protein